MKLVARRAKTVAFLSIVGASLAGVGLAQGAGKGVSAHSGSAPQTSASIGVSLGAMEAAARSVARTIVQLRRFFDGKGGVVTVREELKVDANGSADAPYSLTFLGVEGEPAGSPISQQWAQNYVRYGSLFHQHGGFCVRDSANAQHNYALHDFGPVVRAGRAAQRVVVFPNRLDKAIWLLDVDAVTMVPLYTAEYDASCRLLAEIEAVSFTPAVQLLVPDQRTMTVAVFPDFAAARQHMGTAGLVEPSRSFTDEYALHRVQVTDNPLNGRRSLVLTYSDGIDEFFVVETPGASDYFAGLPSQGKSSASQTNTMARYRDPSMTVLVFWDENVGFQVAGRGSLRRLDGFARSIYTQALLTH